MNRTEARNYLQHYIDVWALQSDGPHYFTNWSILQPVLYQSQPAILKVAMEAEEQGGFRVMEWWNGHGAAGRAAHAGTLV